MTAIPILVAFAVAAGLTWFFSLPTSRLHILDYPNERSLHTHPVPRSGGVALLGGMIAGAIIMGMIDPGKDHTFILMLASAIPVAAVSFLDDRFGAHPVIRIVVHFGAAFIWLRIGYRPDVIEVPGLPLPFPPFFTVLVLLLFIVWMINLYNFMDGMDGFAASMAIIGFTTFAILGGQAGSPGFAKICLLIVGATMGFLLFNFPPAKIFMGDTGSSTLGFFAAILSLWASHEGLFPLWIAVLVFSPFIVDASVTLVRRFIQGEKIWRPHKTHYYQRLAQMGWGHHRTLLAECVLMLACSVSALLAIKASTSVQIILILIWMLSYILLMVTVACLERRFTGGEAGP